MTRASAANPARVVACLHLHPQAHGREPWVGAGRGPVAGGVDVGALGAGSGEAQGVADYPLGHLIVADEAGTKRTCIRGVFLPMRL